MTLTHEDKQQVARLAGFEMGRRSFQKFLPYVRVIEPGTGMVELRDWPHLKHAISTMNDSRMVIWAKSRQIGITTILSAYVLHHASFTPNALALVFSKGERDAWEFLSKSRATY